MKTRRSTRSSSSDCKDLLESLHAFVPEGIEQITPETKHSTLAEASKQDVDKLLDRAGNRGAASQEQKRGYTSVEGEASLFYQRNAKHTRRSSQNSLICGSMASSINDVTYGTSLRESNNEFVENVKDDSLMGINVSKAFGQTMQKETSTSASKLEDSSENGIPVEEEFEWEFGSSSSVQIDEENVKAWTGEINIEVDFDDPVVLQKKGRKTPRRFTAKDKEFAELVHKVHLLCLIARGRLIDAACDDPLLQASLLSLLPMQICISDIENIRASDLEPIMKWFHETFQIAIDKVISSSSFPIVNEDVVSFLFKTLNLKTGSSEMIAALSVSLLRALGFTVRFVAVLNVFPLKPNASFFEASAGNIVENVLIRKSEIEKSASNLGKMLASCVPKYLREAAFELDIQSRSFTDQNIRGTLEEGKGKMVQMNSDRTKQKIRKVTHSLNGAECSDVQEIKETEKETKKKGDLEFELQLAMAMTATAVSDSKTDIIHTEGSSCSPKGRDMEKNCNDESDASVKDAMIQNPGGTDVKTNEGAIWSRKMGPLLHWAEVYCGGIDGGRWVAVDLGRGILDAAAIVEGAAASCKIPLGYILAFAGGGAKDVTRRYVTRWSTVVSIRVNSGWWNASLAPLQKLEFAATASSKRSINSTSVLRAESNDERECIMLPDVCKVANPLLPSSQNISINDRAALEDMELSIKEYTEPLPKNQQAYRNHHLYVLERWLTKYQTLHPRGPILGYCAGNPVFPRTCVQNLHTAQRWRREGRKVRDDEIPVKIVENSRLPKKRQADAYLGDAVEESPTEHTTALFGRWQTESWQPPVAVGGIVPKNERGNVELWSEKCLPLGTVHIVLPRILPLAKKLEIDFAPAMVGYEIRNRKSVPVFEGIIVCKEYETFLLQAYAEEEQRRNAEIEKRKEEQAIARWCRLLSSVTTRQRLQATYQVPMANCSSSNDRDLQCRSASVGTIMDESSNVKSDNVDDEHHEHRYPEEKQSYDELTGVRTKTCHCGYVLIIEEM